jgi:hypothetical protein
MSYYNNPAPDLTEITGIEYFGQGQGKWGYIDGVYQYIAEPNTHAFDGINTKFVFAIQGQYQKATNLKNNGFIAVSCGRNWSEGHVSGDRVDGHCTIWWKDTGKDERCNVNAMYLPWTEPPKQPDVYQDPRYGYPPIHGRLRTSGPIGPFKNLYKFKPNPTPEERVAERLPQAASPRQGMMVASSCGVDFAFCDNDFFMPRDESCLRFLTILRFDPVISKRNLSWLKTRGYHLIGVSDISSYWVNGYNPDTWSRDVEHAFLKSIGVSTDIYELAYSNIPIDCDESPVSLEPVEPTPTTVGNGIKPEPEVIKPVISSGTQKTVIIEPKPFEGIAGIANVSVSETKEPRKLTKPRAIAVARQRVRQGLGADKLGKTSRASIQHRVRLQSGRKSR